MQPEEYIQIVNNLNDHLETIDPKTCSCFNYKTNGYQTLIMFGEHILYNDDWDERGFDEEKDDYEPLEPYLKRRFNENLDELNKFRFNVKSYNKNRILINSNLTYGEALEELNKHYEIIN
jgi:hypothetical protein